MLNTELTVETQEKHITIIVSEIYSKKWKAMVRNCKQIYEIANKHYRKIN